MKGDDVADAVKAQGERVITGFKLRDKGGGGTVTTTQPRDDPVLSNPPKADVSGDAFAGVAVALITAVVGARLTGQKVKRSMKRREDRQ